VPTSKPSKWTRTARPVRPVRVVEPPSTTTNWQGETVEVRRVSGANAAKSYVCPGCQRDITPGVAHVVVVPQLAPDLRRHWHTSCWQRRASRRPTGR
jgi:hypothetical protein